MTATEVKIVDPRYLREYYANNDHIMFHLSKCNQVEYLAGSKIGYSHVLTLEEQWNDAKEVFFNLRGDTITFIGFVVDKIKIDTRHIILVVAEKKIDFAHKVCPYDYNVLDMNALPDIRYYLRPADQTSTTTITNTPKTYQEILDDIALVGGFTLAHDDADYITTAPVNVCVGGMPVLEAVEYILRAIGHSFRYDNELETFKVFQNLAPTITDFESYELHFNAAISTSVAFPVLRTIGDNQSLRISHYTTITEAGMDVTRPCPIYYPFAVELRNENDAVVNSSNLTAIAAYLRGKFDNNNYSYRYVVGKFRSAEHKAYAYTRSIYRDHGYRPQFILESEPIHPHEIPASPHVSQSINLLKFESVGTYDSETTDFDAQIHDLYNDEVKNTNRPILDPLALLIGQPVGTEGLCLRVGEKFYALNKNDVVMSFDAEVSSNASGTVTICKYNGVTWDTTALKSTGYNLSTSSISQDTLVVGTYIHQAKIFVTDGLGGGGGGAAATKLIAFTLTEDMGATTAGQASASVDDVYNGTQTSPTTVKDKQGIFPLAKSGAKGYAVWDTIGSEYVILTCQQRALLIQGILDDQGGSPAHAMKPDTVCRIKAGYIALSPSPFNQLPASLNTVDIDNRLRLWGYEDDKVILALDQSIDAYFALAVVNNATLIEGQATADFEDTDFTVSIDNVFAKNGYIDFTTVDVANIHGWDGKDNDKIQAVWNVEDQRWDMIQKDC